MLTEIPGSDIFFRSTVERILFFGSIISRTIRGVARQGESLPLLRIKLTCTCFLCSVPHADGDSRQRASLSLVAVTVSKVSLGAKKSKKGETPSFFSFFGAVPNINVAISHAGDDIAARIENNSLRTVRWSIGETKSPNRPAAILRSLSPISHNLRCFSPTQAMTESQ